MAGLIKIDTSGNVEIAGNLHVAGAIESKSVKTGELTTDKLIIAAEQPTTYNLQPTTGEITTNATAGEATIPAYSTEITINNPKVTDFTLVYVTPSSSTLNNVLYVKSKEAGQFIVGFTRPVSVDVTFNWWVVDVVH